MISKEMIAALVEARRKMSKQAWDELTEELAGSNVAPTQITIQDATNRILSRDAAWILSETFKDKFDHKQSEIAAVMQTVDCLVADNAPTEIIWTGPANKRFPVRRIDQVLYDLISQSSQSILLVTFAAHRIPHLCLHLKMALERGVKLTLIVESEEESEGQLGKDACIAFKDILSTEVGVYYWPLAKRDRNSLGRPGKLHVKCALIDNVALVGSANLTDDAFNRNMELGILIRELSTVTSLKTHFSELIHCGYFIPYK